MKAHLFLSQRQTATGLAQGTPHRFVGEVGGSAHTVTSTTICCVFHNYYAVFYAETATEPHWVGIYPKSSSTSCDSALGTCSYLLEWEDKTTVRWTQQDHTNWHDTAAKQTEFFEISFPYFCHVHTGLQGFKRPGAEITVQYYPPLLQLLRREVS